ncbi:MAG: molybdenum cofactor guanylyltransferase MobA [Betaproteobacteria bacterium]
MAISSIILAGGRATRMGGVDKGLVAFQQKPLILHVIERLKPQVDEIIINANREISQYQTLNYPVRQDETADFSGPLAGINLGLKYAKYDYLLAVPCDSPLIPLNLASRLMAALIKNGTDIAVATCNGESQPVFCLCKKNVAKSLDDYLISGGRKVSAWQKCQKYIEVDFSDCSEAFVNLNTLADLAVLEAKVLP